MRIGGLQKLSLIDFPGKIACVVFTQGCNFRCSYCHNPDLIATVPPKDKDAPWAQGASLSLSDEKVLGYLEKNTNMLDGVCITGGEPTLQGDLPKFIEKVRRLGLLVKLDTNGSNPAMVQELIAANLVDYIAMDIKHTWVFYERVVQSKNQIAIENCQKTFKLIQESGVDHEFRTTVFPQAHKKENFFEIAGYLRDGEKYFIQNIRYQNTLDPNIDKTMKLNVSEIIAELHVAFPKLYIEER